MRSRHRLNAAVEGFDELIHRAAALAGIPCNHSKTRHHIFYAVIEFGDQHALAFFRLLAFRDIQRQASEAHKSSSSVELCSRRFLKPNFPSIWADEAEIDCIRRPVRPNTMYQRFEARAVVRMDPREEVRGSKSLLRIESEDLRRVRVAPRRSGADIPVERRHSTGRERLLQSSLALFEDGLVLSSLSEQRGENECTKRHGQDAGLSAQYSKFDRKVGVAEVPDAKSYCPNDCK